MASALHRALRETLKISDEEFGRRCSPEIHRTQIWQYRRGGKIPRADTATAILHALARLGVVLTLDDLLSRRRRHRAA